MEKTVLVLLAIVIVAASISPTGALYQSSAEIGQGSVLSGLEPTPTPLPSDVTVEFIITEFVNIWYYEIAIILRNVSDKPISDWKLEFDYDGKINVIWPCTYIHDEIHNTCMPINQWQDNYTIPAGGYVELSGNGREMGSGFYNVTVNGAPVPYTFNTRFSDMAPQHEALQPAMESSLELVEAIISKPAELNPELNLNPESDPQLVTGPTSEPADEQRAEEPSETLELAPEDTHEEAPLTPEPAAPEHGQELEKIE